MRKRDSQVPMLTDSNECLIGMIGTAPADSPYLSIRSPRRGRGGPAITTISSARTLRALAHRILVALGEEKST